MSLQEAARQEAERRYRGNAWTGPFPQEDTTPNALTLLQRRSFKEGFEAGAAWAEQEAAAKVFVVLETTGEYSDSGTDVSAVFSTRRAAEEYVSAAEQLPAIPGESGSPGVFDIVEFSVWESATQRVMTWNISEMVGPTHTSPRERPPYRVERYIPEGSESSLERAELDFDGRSKGWAYIHVTSLSREEAIDEYIRLFNEFKTPPEPGSTGQED